LDNLPLFPLKLVLLPYEILPLHIFEPRYKQMVKNAIESKQPFGIVLKEEEGVYKKGCRVEVTKVLQKYPNGEYDIIVKGIERFKVLSTEKDGDMVFGRIEYIPISIETDLKLIDNVQDSYLKILLRYGINSDMEMHMNKKISYEYVKSIQLPIILKKELINMEHETDRLAFIKNIFDNILKQPNKPENGNFPEA
jgi:Lon protease-like protein